MSILESMRAYIERRCEAESASNDTDADEYRHDARTEHGLAEDAWKILEQSAENHLHSLASVFADALANHPSIRLIVQKLDKLMADATANQQDLDAKLSELNTVLTDALQAINDRLGALVQSSPTFNSEVASIQSDIDRLKTFLPAVQTANAAPAPAAPEQPARAPVVDAHPELTLPEANKPRTDVDEIAAGRLPYVAPDAEPLP